MDYQTDSLTESATCCQPSHDCGSYWCPFDRIRCGKPLPCPDHPPHCDVCMTPYAPGTTTCAHWGCDTVTPRSATRSAHPALLVGEEPMSEPDGVRCCLSRHSEFQAECADCRNLHEAIVYATGWVNADGKRTNMQGKVTTDDREAERRQEHVDKLSAPCVNCFESPCVCEPLLSNDNVPSMWGKV